LCCGVDVFSLQRRSEAEPFQSLLLVVVIVLHPSFRFFSTGACADDDSFHSESSSFVSDDDASPPVELAAIPASGAQFGRVVLQSGTRAGGRGLARRLKGHVCAPFELTS
jgi:hypothetical protein